MNKYSFNNGYGTIYNFDIVEKIPAGMQVWNIGENMKNDNLIPFCFTVPATYEIIPENLKAVYLPIIDAQILRRAAGRGICDIKSAKKFIKRGPGENTNKKITYNLAVAALPILTNIMED